MLKESWGEVEVDGAEDGEVKGEDEVEVEGDEDTCSR